MAAASSVRRDLERYRRKRDFGRTPEPSGDEARAVAKKKTTVAKRTVAKRSGPALQFVIQKHAASNLHFDLRLELDGVMKSWAVPKGPSLDPSVKRLAMEVEDHPMEYNSFEGTIPKGQYGGGTVMLWDRGTYTADEADDDHAAAVREGLKEGKLSITFHGDRLRGSFALVRTRRDESTPQWLLMKHRDDEADPARDIVAEVTTSVDSGRTMEEIAGGKSRVWQSNRDVTARASRTRKKSKSQSTASLLAALSPMLATPATEPPRDERDWIYEPKYDGIRILAIAVEGRVALITRNGKDKAAQFPEIAEGVLALSKKLDRPLVLDGEIVAWEDGAPLRFQALQGRMHVTVRRDIARLRKETPAVLMAFDVLVDGSDLLVSESWHVRRRRLEQLLRGSRGGVLRLGEVLGDDYESSIGQARSEGWEGLIAKCRDAEYAAGRRSRDWLKLKIEQREEFVVGGWTEPRNSREHLGAILLGYHDRNGEFVYAGHTGGGFSRATLNDMYRRLARLERKNPPFATRPKTNEKAHWVKPAVVVEVKFNEWTNEGKLRQPIFVGVRDDKDARDVAYDRRGPGIVDAIEAPQVKKSAGTASGGSRAKSSGTKRKTTAAKRGKTAKRSTARSRKPSAAALKGAARVAREIAAVCDVSGSGRVDLGGGESLDVTNLRKVFFPKRKQTKGDVMQFYARISPYLLPAIEDRPLVLKRFPNGIRGQAFYQQKAPPQVPEGVRVEVVRDEGLTPQRRLIGGNLTTLLYLVQLGAISVDPWHSRIPDVQFADYTIIDLDPGPKAPFRRVVQIARWVKEELDELGLHGVLKTSGASGMHVVLPLPGGVTNETAKTVAELVANRVCEKHPKEATVRRMVKSRPTSAVYVDYLQNIRGKTVASVYSVRAEPEASVSTPLEWGELTDDLDPREFTIETVPARISSVGDIWGAGMARPNRFDTLLEG
jgi:bifunctional non-homologous end joining protein LigD